MRGLWVEKQVSDRAAWPERAGRETPVDQQGTLVAPAERVREEIDAASCQVEALRLGLEGLSSTWPADV